MSRSFRESASPAGSIAFADLVSSMDGEVEALVHRLPAGVDVIERVIAEGTNMDELDRMLGSLPSADEVEQLSAALDDPGKLMALLAARDAGITAHAASLDRKRTQ